MKKLSLKGLADFMTASAVRQRTILKQFKYPQEDDAQAKILYYGEARDRIVAYHRSNHDPDWLLEEAFNLRSLAAATDGKRKERLRHNARALQAYAKHFGGRNFQMLSDLAFQLPFDDVVITVYPDLHMEEEERERIGKLEFNVQAPSAEMIKIISQAMFEAAQNRGLPIAGSDVLYLDVPRGKQYKGARMRSRMKKNIEAACKNISAIWDTI